MLNIDDRLFDQADQSEFWLLCAIVRRINKKNTCWPSNKLLMEDTGWKIDKLQRYKKLLVDKGLIEIEERAHSSNIYHVKTDFIGVFVSANDLGGIPEKPVYQPTGKTSIPLSEIPVPPPTGKTSNRSINNSEVLTNEVLTKIPDSKESVPEYLFTEHQKPKIKANAKKKKEANPAFSICVDFWLKQFHPDWVGFNGGEGKALNLILDHLKLLWEKNHIEPFDKETALNSFKMLCLNIPEFYKTQNLKTIYAKLDGIITEIKSGKTKRTPAKQSIWEFTANL